MRVCRLRVSLVPVDVSESKSYQVGFQSAVEQQPSILYKAVVVSIAVWELKDLFLTQFNKMVIPSSESSSSSKHFIRTKNISTSL